MSENAPTETPEKPAKSKRAVKIREKSRATVKESGKKWAELSPEERTAVKKTVRDDLKGEAAERKAKREKKKAEAAS